MDFLSPVLKLIGSQLIAEYARINGISDKLNSWGEKLPTIRVLLDSAEEKQMHDDDSATIQWLADLRDVAYDMEDLLDMFAVDAKLDSSKVQARSRSSKLPRCLIACCSRFRPRTLISGHHMANEIEDIDRRLERVLSRIPSLQLVQNLRSMSHNDLPRFITTSLPEPKFVGREKQMEELLARLTRSESATGNSARPFTVVSIVGMGGLGKTTLAQELYNHESLKNADFVVKAWACVSDVFDLAAITKSILDQVAPSSSSADLNLLQSSLRDKLSGKKFLLVLDDVWNDKYEELESLLKPMYSGSKGSRILLTTRNFEVARMMGDRDPKQLELMSLEECLSLLAYHSIGEENFEGHPHLQEISVQLVRKCKGLPLSIKTIGGMLRFQSDDEQWKRVLTHSSWDREGGKIPPALKLSYVHLPIHLKRCFAACALFPKDYVFDQDELIRLWIIQGLLQKGTARTLREAGMENLRWLEALSFLQRTRDDKNFYSMHDLINDLAKSVDARSYFSSDEFKEGSTSCEVFFLDKVRHAAMVTQLYESCRSKRFEAFRSMKKLRTFMPFQISEERERFAYVSDDVIQDLIVDMKNLRMLSLRFFKIKHVPDRIGELKLLRSVDFSHTDIQVLPESICDLVELQSLLLRGCEKLQKLPRNIHKLANFLHLDITGTKALQVMPPCIGDLKNLEILSDFITGKEVGQDLKQLGPLERLQQELHIRNLLNVDDVEDARIANISGKEAVIELSLDWGSCSEISREDDHQFKLLDHLRPPRKIESLEICHYGAKRFPKWFDNQYSMNYVMSITLRGCKSLDSLPPLGQLPLLQSLDICGLQMVSSIGPEFYGSRRPFFRSLKSLSFKDMGSWEKWLYNGEEENDSPFPCLRQLIVEGCPKLKGGCTLSLPSLVEVNIDGCDGRFLKCLAGLTSMTKMEICHIPELVHFEGSLATSWVALEEMKIVKCPQFKSFVKGDGGKKVPPNLKVLEIKYCGELEKLAEDLSGLTSLSKMTVADCEKLCSFPSGGLPSSLRILNLGGCPILPQSRLISRRLLYSLVELSLWNLEGIVSITELVGIGSPLSRSLRKFVFGDCRSLTTLTDSLQHLSTLVSLVLVNCPALEMEIFPSLPRNLSSFVLGGCPKVKSLPYNMHHLTLLELIIINCQGIMSFSSRGGLPPNLEWLYIDECKNLNQRIEEWGLRGLTTLRKLSIGGEMECVDGMECFPPPTDDDGDWSRLLPSSLVSLHIWRMKKLERVGGGLRHHLTSLRSLYIDKCERLRCLPDDGLPDSLESLSIRRCTEELVEKCRKGKGEYWHSHLRLIPQIFIE